MSEYELQELIDILQSRAEAAGGDPNLSTRELQSLASFSMLVKTEMQRRNNGGAITASATTFVVPADRRPNRVGSGSATAITASGVDLNDGDSLGHEFADAMKRSASDPRIGKTQVAKLHVQRSADRTLTTDDPIATAAVFKAAAAEHAQYVAAQLAQPQALVAAGGLGTPEAVDYAIAGFEVADRPVRDALPSFTATRGGVRFVRPPTLADLEGSVGIWSMANDIAAVTDPAVRKPILRVPMSTEVVVDLMAVTNRLLCGNTLARAFPEYVTRITELALAVYARVAEQQLLTQIGALSTAVSGAAGEGAGVGATRVLLPLLDRAATGMRDRLRMAQDAPLQLVLPHWSKGILRSDLAMQEPGDAREGVTDAELIGYLAARNLAPTFALDGEAGQHFDVQDPGPVNAWPTEIVSYMFPAGAFQFMDGGTLDLGIVRDSELNAANDFEMFSEGFEAVLHRGGEAFRISQAVTPSGISRAAA
ncbi:major capsid protein [Modestobacter sp. DSM 44400]|uniref:major capsid protein n=1 Tax=Modestobacter sp. DSM 44400 TaxID=1550230 RepID=UPI000B82FE1D|nr:major capsid protein [Modestobacter sp. DSM 44400]